MNCMTSATTGKFWAVGVGPGDPELLTCKAVNVLRQAEVIYHPGPALNQGRALDTVRSVIRNDQERRIVLRDPMAVVSAGDWRRHYREAVDAIAADCRAGRNVVFITEGDPTLYSTATHVWQLLAELHPDVLIEVIPGVSSITAAAARVGWPLVQKDEPLIIVPAGYHLAKLQGWIDAFPTICLLKPAKTMSQLVPMLQQLEPRKEIIYVEDVGTAREWVTRDLPSALDRNNYFSLILVRSKTDGQSNELSISNIDVVGLGPGDPSLLTQQALNSLHRANVIIGYDGYLRRLAPLGLKAQMISHPIGAEAERCRQAIEEARSGKRVALVSSGDAGVYGMASLLLETAATIPDLDIEVIPGVTAATAAAALLGAPLGHDFACISLSDLLTPWEIIERRLSAAAAADFVVVIYNPTSQQRTWQLPRAREALLANRGGQTPVGIVDKGHRPGMRVWHTTLGELTGDGIGMETTIIVGNSQTRLINGRMVTPRGYSASGRRGPPVASTVGSRPPLAIGIMQESFSIIEREVGTHVLPPWAFAVVRRMIHASADFEYAKTLRYSGNFEQAIRQAFRDRVSIVTDTEMVLLGIRSVLAENSATMLGCHLNDPETLDLAISGNLTRSAAGIRIAKRKHSSPLLVIGNAPTALEEALRLVDEEGWRPAAIIGMPVGFVGVEEAKGRLLGQSKVPYLTCVGRKGGSAVAAAAVNALADWNSSP
jgi:precorrin-2 C(20)-methyltransferase